MGPLSATVAGLLSDTENHDDVRVYRNPGEGAVVMWHDGERTQLVELCEGGLVVTRGRVQG